MKVSPFRAIIAGAALLSVIVSSAPVSCRADTSPKGVTHQVTPIVKLGSAIQEEYDNWTPANRTQVLLDISTAKNAPAPDAVIVKNHA